MGVRGRRGDSIEAAVREALRDRAAALVDVPISRAVVSRHYRGSVLPNLAE